MAIEAQAYFRNFRVLHVLIGTGGAALPSGSAEVLSLMMSGLMILTKCDVLKMIAGTSVAAAELAAFGWGDAQTTWSPRAEFAMLADPEGPIGLSLPVVSVDPHAWWDTEHGARDKQTLAYLEKRMDLADRKLSVRPPRKPLLAQLTRFMRWP